MRDVDAPRLKRKPLQYARASPNAIASGSKAQMMYFVADAQADIAALLDALEAERSARVRLEEALETARAWINDNLREGDIPGCTALAAATNALAAIFAGTAEMEQSPKQSLLRSLQGTET